MSLDRKRTPIQRRELALMVRELDEFESWMKLFERTNALVPPGWNVAHLDARCTPEKTRLTIRLDADVVKWYRHLGRGWHNRMNQILRSYMRARISKLIEEPGDRDLKDEPI